MSFCDLRKQVCPDGAVCIPDGDSDNIGLCLRRCLSDVQCPIAEATCRLIGTAMVCVPR
jgi:hypothetical protein